MKYEDNVLIKLRRDYEKDEVVMFALNKIKELQTELGKANSYIQELEDKFGRNKKLNKECKLDELYLMRSKENERLRRELKLARQTNRDLIYKKIQNKKLKMKYLQQFNLYTMHHI